MQFKNQAIKVRMTLQLRQYLVFVVIAVVILLIIYLKVF